MKLSRILAAGATVALVGASAAFLGQAANAATPTDSYVTASQFGVETSPYPAGWFKGDVSPATPGTLTSTPSGLSISGGKTQILDGTTPAQDLVGLVGSASFNVVSGTATFQIPLFANGAASTGYTTLRPALAGQAGLAAGSTWVTSRAIPANTTTGNGTAYVAGATATLQEFQDALGTDYKILAFGAFVNPTDTAVISSITWNGSTTWFTPQPTVAVSTTTISLKDFMTTGVIVKFTGFVPGETVTAGIGAGQRGGATGQTAVADPTGAVTFTFVGSNTGPVGTIAAGTYTLGAYAPVSGVAAGVAITVTANAVTPPTATTPAPAPVAAPAAPVTGNASFTG